MGLPTQNSEPDLICQSFQRRFSASTKSRLLIPRLMYLKLYYAVVNDGGTQSYHGKQD